MERMKIRNPKIKKWRGLLILALIGAIITVAMEIYLSDHALTPDQISKKGQYCAVTSRWMSDAFATETMNGEDTYDYFLVLSEDSDRFFMIRSWTDDEQCLKYIDSLYESGEYEKIDQEWTGGSQPVDDEVKKNLTFLPMSDLAQVLNAALLKPKSVSARHPHPAKKAKSVEAAIPPTPEKPKPGAVC